jgi:hypothetical protein
MQPRQRLSPIKIGSSPIRFSLTGADFSCEILTAKPVRRAAKRKTLYVVLNVLK